MTPSDAETVRNLPFRDASPEADARHADFLKRVAAALPYSAADDELLSRHMAEQTRDLKITPLRRRIPPAFWDGERFVAWIDPR